MKYQEQIKKAYLIELSNKRTIQIDPKELDSVLEGIKSGNPVKVKQGIFNPSFFVDIVLDEKRITEIIEENKLRKFQIERGEKPAELKPLKDIFEEVDLLKAPDEAAAERKRK